MDDPPPERDLAPQVYAEERDAARFMRFHERVRTHEPDWIYALARAVTKVSSSRAPRRTGNAPPWLRMYSSTGLA